MLVLLPLYFLLAIGVSALLVFPSLRAATARSARAFAQGFRRRVTRGAGHAGGMVGGSAQVVRAGVGRAGNTFSIYRWQIAAVLAVVLLPSLFAFVMRHNHTFIYEDRMAGPDPRIQALLTGERLVPPPPLPPEVFTTREVELVRPNLGGASRDWNLLDADYRQRLLAAYRVMREEHGYEMVLIEGYRSPERQAELADKGSHVTNAGAYQSYHQYGLAADSAFLRDGKVVVSEKDPWAMRGYELFGETAERVGLTWGGRWKLMDFGHTELRRPGVIRRDAGAAQ
ncbi:M15 family metallopeptidase [Achromobacter sp. UMC71]|uniref:M15 family metallopeptidase n=1 Tax=Achromobacter sp. UMC71 TaxID=1862320 RepID=UPI0016006BE9|nr:M15 family metallopeptidase [Achromobacter sp. UMC71]MBB1627869.1 D-alanyl-D-alanine carboxypeptidase [Achromobacter sp. UMC71]